ncbi:tetratricopeptide repeat-containing sulfotransferase family protein [Sphingomonas sanxanigenens]|uniref:Uncharacterized protein n=1 Tax=Sphingomonas sanxanigenens DSM 19645 = NX02 TaxID=1123269 RepID=W0ABU0_9SPHN|nr:sulfotransferase [Sphingomonas sanxanigenens]AHE53140.1 hypothetical protein NX02_07065 [Sphingomonas sanxanigenens DSM 19645 = NX02]
MAPARPLPDLPAARRALEEGDLDRCARIATAATQARPDHAEGHFLLAMAMAEGGRIAAALPVIARAVTLAPADAEYRAQLARLNALARREADARAAADAAVALARGADARTLDTIGCVYARLGDHEAAVPLFERAVGMAADDVGFRFNLASSYGFFGRVDDAERHYEAIVARRPGHGRAHLGIAGLRRQTPDRNHAARLEAALATTADPVERLRIHYAAAKEYEDLGDHEAVFRHLATGNAAHKARLAFDIEADAGIVDAIRASFTDPAYFAGPSDIADAPVFVVGLPRTGTTLVDRILAAHPGISSAGELQAMPLALKRLAQTPSRLVLDRETVLAARDLDPARLGAAYLERARQHAGGRAPRFVDKLPLNFLYIGHIARALPNARIVCLRRNPMDSVWSNFKTLFATGSSYYAWSYDLMDTARYYALFDGLIAFWQAHFPGRVLELGYEALVADQEGETRRLLDHVGLPWDEHCLRFHETDEAVATPSAQQVRRPLNACSIGRWRHYARELAPVADFFTARGIVAA